MGNELAETKTFQERIFERIRDGMGDLMSDAELKELVETAVERAYFQPEVLSESTYSGITYGDSTFIKLLRDLLKAEMEVACKQWMEDHSDDVQAHIKETIEKGMVKLVFEYINRMAQGPLEEFGRELEQRLGVR